MPRHVGAEFSAVIFSAVPFPTLCSTCEVTRVINRQCNRFCYLLTYVLTYYGRDIFETNFDSFLSVWRVKINDSAPEFFKLQSPPAFVLLSLTDGRAK